MIGRFLITAEDAQGHLVRAFAWTGYLEEGFERARRECAQLGLVSPRLWADPIANR